MSANPLSLPDIGNRALHHATDKIMRRIDPYSLRLFLAAASEGSIARAAEKEHIAASALSRRIADLEQAFGVALLIRSPHGIALTEAGQVAFARAERIDEDLQSLVREVQTQAGEIAGTVRLFANTSSVVGFLPERLKAFRAEFPLVEIALQERTTEEVVRACLDDRADAGVGAAMDVPGSLESWHFARDSLMVVLPQGHELAKQRSLRYAEVLACPIVGIQTGGSLDRLLRDQAAACRATVRFTVTVSSPDAACRMVEAGLGIAVLPASAAAAYAGARRLVRRGLEETWVERELRLYALRKVPHLRAVDALISALRG